MIGDFVTGLSVSKYVILAIIIFMYIIFGMFLDIMSSIILTIPIFFPVIISLGLDPIWYGVIMVRMMEMGLITPPVGLNVFVLSGVTDIPLNKIFRGVVPFVVSDLFHVILLIIIPAISLFLPNLM
jgi:C4-dicarboxylate transporter DctM subunit